MSQHLFEASVSWINNNKPFSYKEYSREYLVRSEGKADFIGTAAPEFFGSKFHYNPEDLLVVSLSACHMLTYLAYASNSKIKVVSYTDAATGNLFTQDKITKFEKVTLRPKIGITKESSLETAKNLHEKAHHACFIANSINFPIEIIPEFLIVES